MRRVQSCGGEVAEPSDKTNEQKDAEAEVDRFRHDLGPFVVAAETTRMAMVFTDARPGGNPIIFANDSFLLLTGYERSEILGRNFSFLLETDTGDAPTTALDYEFSARAGAISELLYRRKQGSSFWAAIFVTPVVDDKGEVVQHFASLIDLSVHKEEEAQSRMLIDELNHRVKNTLTTVRSIVAQGFRSDGDASSVRDLIESRLFALSRSHDLLARENWRSVGLFDLVGEAMKPFGRGDDRVERLRIVGDNIRLKPPEALALSIALHELATNAVKYGALSNATGVVLISWDVWTSSTGPRLTLRWQESGGPAVVPPSRKGFGSRVIERGLKHELSADASLEYAPAGLICTIDMPAPESGA